MQVFPKNSSFIGSTGKGFVADLFCSSHVVESRNNSGLQAILYCTLCRKGQCSILCGMVKIFASHECTALVISEEKLSYRVFIHLTEGTIRSGVRFF